MSAVALQPATQAVCALCGQRLPARPSQGDYCCSGCAHVAAILQAVGPETEAAQRALKAARARGLLSAPAPLASQSTTHHSLLTTHTGDVPPEAREELRLRVQGLACPSCAWLVEAVLTSYPGVAEARVDYLSDTARVVLDLRLTSREAIERAVAEAGYGLAPLEAESDPEERRDLLRLALAAFVAMNQMTLSWVGYDAFLTGHDDPRALVVGWLQLALALPVVAWSALPLYRRALAALRRGRAVMETLLSLGVLAATALSLAAVLAGQTHVYLETATTLVALSLAGRALERWLKRRATRSLTDLLRFAPTKARGADDGRFAPLGTFARGDRIAVQPGETVPLDVRAVGPVVVREALLTGEPHPAERSAGEIVLAGSTIERGALVGIVERPSGQTVADAIRQRVEEALRRTDAGSRLADRLTQGFVPLVMLVALAALVGHLSQEANAMCAVLVAVSVLVVACPCAFGVAASLALSLAVLRLARAGVLVKDPSVLERLRDVDTVVFDKTGTLTRGEISILHIGWLGPEDASLLASIRAVEAESRHPIGFALARLLPQSPGVVAEGIVEVPGLGVTGMVAGRRVAAGRPELFAQPPAAIPCGPSRVWFGYAGESPAGYMDLSDALRPEAAEVVTALARRGMTAELFSGDAPEPTQAKAAEAGIPSALGGLRPEQKAERVRALRQAGRNVAFIGDGFNDAEAMAAADVGVAMASGADLAMLSAPVVITRGDLRGVVELLDTGRRAVRVLRGNFAWAFVYNVALLPVAACGLLAPIHAAGLMVLSSASVALNSLRPMVNARCSSTINHQPLTIDHQPFLAG